MIMTVRAGKQGESPGRQTYSRAMLTVRKVEEGHIKQGTRWGRRKAQLERHYTTCQIQNRILWDLPPCGWL